MADEDAALEDSGDAGGSGIDGGTAIKAGGGILSGYGSFLAGIEKAKALEFQADVADRNANEAIQQGSFNAFRARLRGQQVLGAAKANYGASGVSTAYGSGAAVLMSSAALSELDRLNILHGADIKAANYENQARIDRFGAGNEKTAGVIGGIGGLVTSAGALAGI
jgi:hypothetical protein